MSLGNRNYIQTLVQLLDVIILRTGYVHRLFRTTMMSYQADLGLIPLDTLEDYGVENFRNYTMSDLGTVAYLFYVTDYDFMYALNQFPEETRRAVFLSFCQPNPAKLSRS